MVLDMKVYGRKICNMETVKNPGLTVQYTKENIKKVKNTDEVFIVGQMVVNMTAIGLKTKLKELEFIHGLMVENIWENGMIIIWMESVSTPGKMVENTRVNTNLIKSMDTENTCGLMVEVIKDIGLKANNIPLVFTKYKINKKGMGYGRTAGGLNGLTNNKYMK